MDDARKLRVVRVCDSLAFAALRPAWDDLLRRLPRRSVFHTHEWFDAAWQWRGQHASLNLLCAYAGDELVGIFPLVRETEIRCGLPCRILRFLSVPDTQLCDLICDPGNVPAACRSFAEALLSAKDWDILNLHYLPENSLGAGPMAAELRKHGCAIESKATGANPYIELQGDWEQYFATRTRSFKKAHNLAINRLNKAGRAEVKSFKGAQSEAQCALEQVIEISAHSWKRHTGNALDQAGPQAFIRRLQQLAADRGWWLMWLLALDGKSIAMECQLVYEGNIHALRADFVEGYPEISPGAYLNRELLVQSFGCGLQRYYMGPGDNAYKQRWAQGDEQVHELTAYGPRLRARGFALIDLRLKPFARRVRARFAHKEHVTEKDKET
ncbi:MAG TPA: GNAT family N-acetyltransferase [Burkholderiales bacterium]|nr:GNAT family N-acetyltransferase [Burkholderiales bacterium]